MIRFPSAENCFGKLTGWRQEYEQPPHPFAGDKPDIARAALVSNHMNKKKQDTDRGLVKKGQKKRGAWELVKGYGCTRKKKNGH